MASIFFPGFLFWSSASWLFLSYLPHLSACFLPRATPWPRSVAVCQAIVLWNACIYMRPILRSANGLQTRKSSRCQWIRRSCFLLCCFLATLQSEGLFYTVTFIWCQTNLFSCIWNDQERILVCTHISCFFCMSCASPHMLSFFEQYCVYLILNGVIFLPWISCFSFSPLMWCLLSFGSCARLGRWGAKEAAEIWLVSRRRHLQNRRAWWACRCRTARLEKPAAGLQEPATNRRTHALSQLALLHENMMYITT